MDAAEDRERAERNRLLYVALTRAESWLIVAAAGNLSDDPEKRVGDVVWRGRGGPADPRCSAADVPELDGPGLRLPDRNDRGRRTRRARSAGRIQRVALPDWAMRRPCRSRATRPRFLPRTSAATRSSCRERCGAGPGDALRRGRLVHLLLEHLPNVPPPGWRNAAPRIAALEAPDCVRRRTGGGLCEAERVLTAPHLAHVFDPETLAEVALHADSAVLGRSVLGAIDRLIVTETRVLPSISRPIPMCPTGPEDVPEGLLRQMGAYAEMLRAIYPGREIATAILWSRTATAHGTARRTWSWPCRAARDRRLLDEVLGCP
jgi:ATP-dependent helicase/nuclease subunit A